MLHVTAADCGEWIPGYSNDREESLFLINVIELAVGDGMQIADSIASDMAVIRAGVGDSDTFLRVFDVQQEALEYLQASLPHGFWFEAETWGLYLLTTADDGSIVGY